MAASYSNLAAVLQVRGEIDSAIACSERGLRLQPDLLVAHTNLSKLLVSLGRMEEAERLYRHAIALKPDSAEAHFELGNLYCQLNRLEDAIDCFRAAIRSHIGEDSKSSGALEPECPHLSGYCYNLCQEALKRGVAANRLVFAQQLPVAEYLARYRLADLFLDTFVYSAGSAAVAALQAGVPVLTLPGIANASRMGASICAAALLPEMICSSQEEYERRAIYLGNNLDELAAIRGKLAENQSSAPLFYPRQFVRHLEEAFRQMWGDSQWAK
ncbi:MAG: tetratricopeptide repeat protein [Oscillatoria princeps RMCB-10]|nr:tetratricopeptide repeat protein [Oscillatoria princeps RMCB-10]